MTKKLCSECKWCIKGWECDSPRTPRSVDLVTGIVAKRWTMCSSHRDDWYIVSLIFSSCGKRGRWWEPKS